MVVLFGDIHRSEQNYCSPCICTLENQSCCYKLSDPSFLRSIDKLASMFSVDFYTETFFEGTGMGFFGGMMKEMTTGNMISCYNRHLRGTYEDLCPTKNIRWQGANIRQAGTTLRDLYGIEDTKFVKSNKYLKNSYIEYQVTGILRLISLLLGNDEIFRNFYLPRIEKDLSESYFKDLPTFQTFLLSIFDGNNFNFKNFSKTLFSMMNKDNSIIYKQVIKQTYGNFMDIKQWEDFYSRSLQYFFYLFNMYKAAQFRSIVNNLDKYINGEIKINDSDKKLFSECVTDILTGLLDIYFISRMFKQPTDGKISDLTFAYFGDYHILIIKDLLLSTGAYELVVSKNLSMINSYPDRCLNFSDVKIDLDRDITNHNKS